MIRRHTILLAALLLALGSGTMGAHTLDETYLTLRVSATNVAGQWEVADRDLQQGLKLDPNRWQTMSPAERERWQQALALDTVQQLYIKLDGRALVLRVTDVESMTRNAGEYTRVQFDCPTERPPTAAIQIDTRALSGLDVSMHGRLCVECSGRTEAAVFNAEHPLQTFLLAQPAARWAEAWTFVREGFGHIWKGPDHLLFLLALLLPAVFRWADGAWAETESFGPTVVRVLKIVTAFTAAHTLTLSLAVLGIAQIPARIVEPLIAATVIAAALNNLRPWFGGRAWLVAFGFGLVHGFGLASGLIEFGLRRETLAISLVSFNVGVELGQITMVALFLPAAFLLRQTWFYRNIAFKFGSAAVALVAGIWMVERLLDFKLLPF